LRLLRGLDWGKGERKGGESRAVMPESGEGWGRKRKGPSPRSVWKGKRKKGAPAKKDGESPLKAREEENGLGTSLLSILGEGEKKKKKKSAITLIGHEAGGGGKAAAFAFVVRTSTEEKRKRESPGPQN